MHRNIVLAGMLSLFLAAPALAQDYGNPVTGDDPTPGTYLTAPQAIERTPVASQRITLPGNCNAMRDGIDPGSDDLTEQKPGTDPVPGVYNMTFCG